MTFFCLLSPRLLTLGSQGHVWVVLIFKNLSIFLTKPMQIQKYLSNQRSPICRASSLYSKIWIKFFYAIFLDVWGKNGCCGLRVIEVYFFSIKWMRFLSKSMVNEFFWDQFVLLVFFNQIVDLLLGVTKLFKPYLIRSSADRVSFELSSEWGSGFEFDYGLKYRFNRSPQWILRGFCYCRKNFRMYAFLPHQYFGYKRKQRQRVCPSAKW